MSKTTTTTVSEQVITKRDVMRSPEYANLKNVIGFDSPAFLEYEAQRLSNIERPFTPWAEQSAKEKAQTTLLGKLFEAKHGYQTTRIQAKFFNIYAIQNDSMITYQGEKVLRSDVYCNVKFTTPEGKAVYMNSVPKSGQFITRAYNVWKQAYDANKALFPAEVAQIAELQKLPDAHVRGSETALKIQALNAVIAKDFAGVVINHTTFKETVGDAQYTRTNFAQSAPQFPKGSSRADFDTPLPANVYPVAL